MYILIALLVIWFLTAFFSYYLFYTITISVCTIGILAIFFWKIVWDGLHQQYHLWKNPSLKKKRAIYKEKKRKEETKRLRKLSPFQRWKTTTKEKLNTVFSWILVPVIFLGVPAGAFAIGGDFLLDFPSYLLGKSETATGYISDYVKVSGRKSLSYISVEIDNKDYLLTQHEEFGLGDQVKIHYLPHTKIIRKFEIVDERKIQPETEFTPPDPSIKDNPAVGSWDYSNENEDEYISLLFSDTGLATLAEIKGEEGIFYSGRWKYDEKENKVIFEVEQAEDRSWKPVEHPDKIEIKVLSVGDDSLEIELHQKKVPLTRIW
ncbi:hypothetical protein A8F94_14935 [Bacillus sp. FJAT-27225]|uniref:hypothetical protein n=1 Tax=Bacillus sp. FJAT-27225 TaxID=1743144 RepID=UPI00080C2D30|nr:hypothetical protein [Bacillus sp. FJAT-27225]OCA84029.1 hypothetical protein A8F94_14935 [Bacillus sp. FJAT-27225]